MPKIKTKYTADEFAGLKDQPLTFADLFEESDDGAMVLRAEAVGGLQVADVEGLQKALREERTKAKTAASELAPWKKAAEELGVTPGDLASKLEEAERASRSSGDKAEAIAKEKERLKAEWEAKVRAESARAEAAEGKLREQLDRTAIDALIGDAVPAKRRVLEAYLSRNTRRVEEGGVSRLVAIDEHGQPLFSKKNTAEHMGADEYVAQMRESRDFEDFFVSADRSGDGAGGGGGGGGGDLSTNPFANGPSFNLTEAGRLLNQEPARAAKLKDQAKAAGKLATVFV